jgi:uncharacterized protein HemX|tara:strand:+ start:1292 stop:1663 length:372 start_codon:yes stop_codon:yes gene_type:complete
MSKILIGIIVAMILAFGGYYWITEQRLATLTENNAKLSIAAQTNQDTIDKLTQDFEQQQELNAELNVKLQASEAYGDALAKKLREHDLTMLTLKKPGLIERRVNSATQKIFDELESDTATTID